MKQIILINGGSAFDTYNDFLKFLHTFEPSLEYLKKKTWKDSLQSELGESFDVLSMQMPNKLNSKYEEWKIYFERYIPLFKNEVVLLGHSLGGLFLAKYLSENIFPKKIIATFLVAAPHDSKDIKESLGDFRLPGSLNKFNKQNKKIFIYQSEDDHIVSVEHAKRYKKDLPVAELVILKNMGHFNQIDFSEIVSVLKNL